jgi:hypothetical protein
MKVYGGMEIKLLPFLTSALVESQYSTSHPSRFNPDEEPLPPITIE